MENIENKELIEDLYENIKNERLKRFELEDKIQKILDICKSSHITIEEYEKIMKEIEK